METTIRAYAKINLFLDVVGKRPDGYHDIVSVMQTVSLADLVTLKRQDAGITLSCDLPSLPQDRKNLAWRAAEAFFAAAGLKGGVQIAIEKHIPVAGGLAGGSTDAAAVLRGLNLLYDRPFSTEALCAIGKTLGADLPFCIVGGAAEVGGIGEVLTPCPPLPDCALVVARAGEGVSTPQAYADLDRRYRDFKDPRDPKREEDLARLRAGLAGRSLDEAVQGFYNVFESVVLDRHAAASDLKKRLLGYGARTALMSGSGPSVFAVFERSEDADAAARALHDPKNQCVAYSVRPIQTQAEELQ